MKDIKYLGVPNICFSLTDKDDKREKKFKRQREERGFDDSETWSLRDTYVNFMIPRLEVFIEMSCGCPIGITFEEWDIILKKILWSLKFIQEQDSKATTPTNKEWRQYKQGMNLLSKWFQNLWW